MLIAVDMGNTNITLVIFDNDQIIAEYRLTTKLQRTSDEYGFMINSFLDVYNVKVEEIEDVIISSVVPKIMHAFTNAIKKYLNHDPIIVGPGIKTGIKLKIPNPKGLGADRLVDAVGAHNTYKRACLVIDFGTATTFDVVDGEGCFLGGATSTGIQVMCQALAAQAAMLPEFEIAMPQNVIAKETVPSMQAGCIIGYIGLTEKLITEIKKEYGADLLVVSTGGLGRVISSETDLIDVYDRNLTFKGLKMIYDKNKYQ